MMFVDWCAICGVHFTSVSAVPRHLCLRRSNVGGVKRHFLCKECSKTHAVQLGVPQLLNNYLLRREMGLRVRRLPQQHGHVDTTFSDSDGKEAAGVMKHVQLPERI